MGPILLVSVLMLTGQASTTRLYRNQNNQCSSYSFEYPTDWEIVKNPDYITEECVTTIRPADYRQRMAKYNVDLSTLTIQVYERSFIQVAGENGFDFDGKWVILGRQGLSADAQITNNNGWLVLRGTASAGCFSEGQGGFAGLCDEYRIVAKQRDDYHVVSISGGTETAKTIDVVLKNFKFVNR